MTSANGASANGSSGASANGSSGASLHHDAFFYDTDDSYVAALVPPIRTALADGLPVMAVVPPSNADLLSAALGTSTGNVEFIAADQWYRHPHGTVAAYHAVLDDLGGRVRPLVIGEVHFGDTELDWAGWTRYEAALNRALDRHDAHIICPYDTRSLHRTVVENARRTHPHVFEGEARTASADYVEPEQLIPHLPPTAQVPTRPPDVRLDVDGTIREARQAFAAAATGAGLPTDEVERLTIAVNEVLTNAAVHGGGQASLRIWVDGGGRLTCVVEDRGPGIEDPLVGYIPPSPGATEGYGMWLARQLFPRSELTSSPDGGLTAVLATA